MKNTLFAQITALIEKEELTGISTATERATLRAELAALVAEEQLADVEEDGDEWYEIWSQLSEAKKIELYHRGFGFIVRSHARYFTSFSDE